MINSATKTMKNFSEIMRDLKRMELNDFTYDSKTWNFTIVLNEWIWRVKNYVLTIGYDENLEKEFANIDKTVESVHIEVDTFKIDIIFKYVNKKESYVYTIKL